MVWKNAGVRRLALASGASQIGDWAGRLTLIILVFDRLGLAWAVGLVSAAFVAAWLGPGQRLAAAVAGPGARRVMIRTEVARATMFVLLALPLIPLNVGVLAGVVLLASLADPVFEINRASLSVAVAGDEYGPAIKLLAAVNQIAQLAGYGAGGIALALLGDRMVFLAIGILFTFSGLILSRISDATDAVEEDSKTSMAAAREFFANDRLSLVTLVATLFVVAGAMAIEALAAVYATDLDLSEAGIGIVAASLPAATFIGVAGIRTKVEPTTSFTFSLAVTATAAAIAVVLFGSVRGLLGASAAYGAIGLALVVSIAGNVVVGSRIPPENRGAVFGVIQGVLYSTMAFSAAAGGFLAEFVGAKATNMAASVLITVAAFGGLLALRSVARHQESAPV